MQTSQRCIACIVRASIAVIARDIRAAATGSTLAGFARGALIAVIANRAVRDAGIFAYIRQQQGRVGHFNGRRAGNVLVMFPQFPNRVAPRSELREKRISLGNVRFCFARWCGAR